MPFKIEKKGSNFLVINEETKRVLGTHTSEKDAKGHLRALYANILEARGGNGTSGSGDGSGSTSNRSKVLKRRRAVSSRSKTR